MKQKLKKERTELIRKMFERSKEIQIKVEGYTPSKDPKRILNFFYCGFRLFYVCIYFYFFPFAVITIDIFESYFAGNRIY
jgi:hypothetical protein